MVRHQRKKKLSLPRREMRVHVTKQRKEVKKKYAGNIDLRGLLPNLASDFNYYIRAIC